MIKPTVRVRVDTRKLDRVATSMDRGLAQSGSGPIADMFKRWSYRVFGFLTARFVKYSRGGGDWPPLSPFTRRKRGDTSRAAILRDTNRLFGALSPAGSPAGKLDQRIPNGIRVGIGGPARYPEGRATIADVASFHDSGAGILPVRRIIVTPDASTIAGMTSDAEKAAQEIANDAS